MYIIKIIIQIKILKFLKSVFFQYKISLCNLKLYYVDTNVIYCVQTSVFNLSLNEIVPQSMNVNNEF
jgi:hypothetical protein